MKAVLTSLNSAFLSMVNGFFNVTSFSHFTMANANIVCCVSNGGRMKAKFTIVKGVSF